MDGQVRVWHARRKDDGDEKVTAVSQSGAGFKRSVAHFTASARMYVVLISGRIEQPASPSERFPACVFGEPD